MCYQLHLLVQIKLLLYIPLLLIKKKINIVILYPGVPEERIAVLSAHKGTQKIIQNGDGTYTFTFSLPQGHKEYIFTSGIEVEDRTKPSDVVSTIKII